MKRISAITFMAYASIVANVFALVNDIDSINESFFRFNPIVWQVGLTRTDSHNENRED